MRDANKVGADYVLILGENELLDKTIMFKDLKSGKQEKIKQKNIISFFNNLTI